MTLIDQVLELIHRQPDMPTQAMAQQLGVSEGDLVRALPASMVTLWSGTEAEALLGQLTRWGSMTTIVESAGCIFEFKGPFPAGRSARGYYNLQGESGLHGHLRLDEVETIALLSKPFMGQESHAFVFIARAGRCAFKIYLGRDEKRRLLPQQVNQFTAWQALPSLPAES